LFADTWDNPASEAIGQAETAADNERRNAVKHSRKNSSYPPGTEYALCNAQAQLMSAVVGVLSESMVEAMKSFYKLRTAYKTLEGLQQTVDQVVAKRGVQQAPQQQEVDTDSSDDEFLEVRSVQSNESDSPRPPPVDTKNKLERRSTRDAVEILDVFIESGTSLCFGILLLFISLIPPALTRLLSVLGFRGGRVNVNAPSKPQLTFVDRERGIKTLWNATKFDNIHGALATVIILNYYSGITQFSDIVEEDPAKGGYPKARCVAALRKARAQHPKSLLWIIEEARMEAVNYQLHKAIEMLDLERKPQMKLVQTYLAHFVY